MARFDDFLQGSMYSRPAQMMNTINQYTNANAAMLPTPTTMTPSAATITPIGGATKPPPPEFTPYSIGTPMPTVDPNMDGRGPDIVGSNMDNLPQIFGDLGIDFIRFYRYDWR